ncbi:MAG: hypothetical protein WC307_03825 [Candidatus Nanoarchaeia archaeon]|jgi:ribonuclease HII
MKILDIDEAGRGALVGPLVIGGFMTTLFLLKREKVLDPKKRTNWKLK